MGALHEQAIPTIFNGVSRQPDPVRFPGQVQEAENVEFSVETGGFGKRQGFRIISKLTGLATGVERRLHTINRDASEKYALVLSPGDIKVYDLDGVAKTVDLNSMTTWLNSSPSEFALMTAIDTTFITKRTDVVTMDAGNLAPAQGSEAVVFVKGHVPSGTAAYKIIIDGVEKASFTADTSHDTYFIADELENDLITNLGAGWSVGRSSSYIFIEKDDGTAFTIEQQSPTGDGAMVIYKGFVDDTSKLPARAIHGMIMNIRGLTGDGFWVKFEANDGNEGEGAWRETVEPGNSIAFDPETMPRILTREADGTFLLNTATWSEKQAGGEDEVPNPDFVGNTIEDLTFHRNRFGIVSGETVYFSQAGDYYNFWPETSTEVIDSDPFGLTNTTRSISKFYFAVPFRRSIFVMADNAQFEISGELLTPQHAVIDLATSYTASTECRPVAIGDELYFPAENDSVSELFSYSYDEQSVSETALSVSKHVGGYIPAPVVQIEGDPITGQLFLRSEAETDALYVHKFFYQGNDRVQSSWGKYVFEGMNILSIGIINAKLLMLYEYDGAVWLGEMPISTEISNDFNWTPRIDHQQMLTGVYDALNDVTIWDVGYNPTNPVGVVTTAFPIVDHNRPLSLEVNGTTVIAQGDWSAHPVMIGENFEAFVTLSKQFVRDQQGTSIVNGRLQLRHMTLRYTDSGYFKVTVTPQGRDDQIWEWYPPVFVGEAGAPSQFGIRTGKFRFGVRTDGETGTIKISSDRPMPFNIVSAAWVGFFNEISRQG